MQKNKQYNIKFYDFAGSVIKTLNPTIRTSDIAFEWNINAGQGQLELQLNLSFDDFGVYAESIDFMNFAKVWEVDENYPNGRLIYTGFISEFEPFTDGSEQGVNVRLVGLGTLLSFSLFKDGVNFDVAYSSDTDPSDIIKDVIDHFQSIYPGTPEWIRYDGGGIDPVGSSIQYNFAKMKWHDVIEKCRELSGGGFFWRINPDGQFYFQQKPVSATHRFIIGKNIKALYAKKNSESIINKVTVKWASSTVSAEDATSISRFGTREAYADESAIPNSATAQLLADQKVADFKDEKIRAVLEVNNQYDIESIKPGDTCKILGTKIGSTVFSDNMLIVSVKYSPEKVRLQLEQNTSFAQEVLG